MSWKGSVPVQIKGKVTLKRSYSITYTESPGELQQALTSHHTSLLGRASLTTSQDTPALLCFPTHSWAHVECPQGWDCSVSLEGSSTLTSSLQNWHFRLPKLGIVLACWTPSDVLHLLGRRQLCLCIQYLTCSSTPSTCERRNSKMHQENLQCTEL